MMENHSYSDIIGDTTNAPYINSLAAQGANFTNSFAIEHPSEPNYLDLFSGSNQGVTDDSCPHTFNTGSLGSEAISAGIGFTGYSESMPSTGYTGCSSGNYARRHNPWVDFSNIPAADNQPFTSFPSDYSTLPAVSFVVPNLQDDMHDGTIAQGDSWLSSNIDGYAQWAKTHNSILVLTWDEDDYSQSNQVPTIVVGSGVKPGSYNEQINHYTVLRTIEDAYGLGHLGSSAGANPITDIWTSSSTGSALVSAASGRCIDDPAFSTTPGTQVEIWDCNGGANQQWTAHPDGSLTTEGLCLDANGGGTTPGTKVILWSCNGGTNQQWTLNSDGTIHGVGSLLCLDVTGAATTNGTPLELWTCNGGTNQQWTHG